MTITTLTRRFARPFAAFARERRGMAAVEFAMLLPMLMTLFLGTVEITTGVAIQRKVTLTARAVADLSSQYTSITATDMSNILNAASDIIVPYSSTTLKTVVSELAIDGSGQATVVWSQTLNGTALTNGQVVNIPTALAVPNSYLLLGQASYSYNPTYGYVVTGTLTLSDSVYMRPRQSSSISYTN